MPTAAGEESSAPIDETHPQKVSARAAAEEEQLTAEAHGGAAEARTGGVARGGRLTPLPGLGVEDGERRDGVALVDAPKDVQEAPCGARVCRRVRA